MAKAGHHKELLAVTFELGDQTRRLSASSDNWLPARNAEFPTLLIYAFWMPIFQGFPTSPVIEKQIPKVQETLERLLGLGMNEASLRIDRGDTAWFRSVLQKCDLNTLDVCTSLLLDLDREWQRARSFYTAAEVETSRPKGLDVDDGADPDENPNFKSTEHPFPIFSHEVFDGEKSTHKNVELLFDLLHSHFPCRDESHSEEQHDQKLAKSKEARLCLDPTWNIDERPKSFVIILKGDGIFQECTVSVEDKTHARVNTRAEKRELCKTVPDCSPRRPMRYDLQMKDNSKLWVCGRARVKVAGLGVNEMSLRQVIDTVDLAIVPKRIIGLVLTRAVLHLLGSRWILGSLPLSIDNIYLCYSLVGDPPKARFQFDKIFLRTEFRDPDIDEAVDPFLNPWLEAVQDLGVVLAKLELGRYLSRLGKEGNFDRPEYEFGNPDIFRALLLKECRRWFTSVPRTIKFLCEDAQSTSLEMYDNMDADELLSNHDFVNTYYTELIRPLEGWLIKSRWTWKQVRGLEPVKMDDDGICDFIQGQGLKVAIQKLGSAHVPCAIPVLHYPLFHDPEDVHPIDWSGEPPGCVMDHRADSNLPPNLADDWIRDFQVRYSNVYRSVDVLEDKHRPKIAIIDTGCQLDHERLKPYVNSGAIAGFGDFIGGTCKEDKMLDEEGHGTHVCHLLLQVAPHAKIYIARAFETSKANNNTAQYVSQAIYHAVDKWKVDMISLSFAFREADPNMRRAIYHATKERVLIFAAASNNSTNNIRPRGYPARESGVISVHSTTDQGEPSPFSPPGEERGSNFAILGENLEAAWPPHLSPDGHNCRRMSGTSQATPILAGIASTILHLSRLKQFGAPSRDVEDKLKDCRGMELVLSHCMTENNRPPAYSFVKPSKLFNPTIKLSDIMAAVRVALSGH